VKWTGLRGADGVLGGDLVDVGTPFAGRDKVQHLALGGYAQLLAERWSGLSVPWCLLIVLALAVLNEVIEGVRFRRYGWTRSLSDEPDGTDVLVTLAGGVVAWLLL
jgi:hypothetical protein